MDIEKRRKNAQIFIGLGVATILFGAVLLMVSSGAKDSVEYHWSSSRRSEVDTAITMCWLLIISGIADVVIYSLTLNELQDTTETEKTEKTQEESSVAWFEGEIVQKEWDPEHHQVEWITVRQKNGLTIRVWHYIADDRIYKVGDRGRVCVKDRLVTEFVPAENGE